MTTAIATCSVDGCDKKRAAKGLCITHYQRVRLTGELKADTPVGEIKRETKLLCEIDGCGRPYAARGVCKTHYARWRKYGEADGERPVRIKDAQIVDGMKLCTKCRAEKPVSGFSKYRHSPSGIHPWCRQCRSASRKEGYKRSPEIYREAARWGAVRHRFGLSRSEFEDLVEHQGGVCAICGDPPDGGRRLAIDHDHQCCPTNGSCGLCIRGLLCIKCNTLLGLAKDDPERLERAISYLRKWSQ